MANERKTENIVRSHFQKFSDITIEEQRSDNTKIQKLLKNASKRGNKNGLPEFIIHFHDNIDLLIVIECKGDISKHESSTRDKYADYSVDGVLLYSSFLSKEYDVIAIAVSGENLKELRVSHFLQIKGTSQATSIFSNQLLSSDNYLSGYLLNPEKFKQDYSSLLTFSKELNDTLHEKKIKESQRSLLISGILIALENKAFEVSYRQHAKPDDLANILVDTISNQLKNANLHSKKLENLKNAYNFIRTHTALSGEKNVLSDIIDKIDSNINKFIKTHKYIDVLGQFYIEFLRYANSDKGLGIVLTPPHITELFTELVGVNKNSIVYDNCTGTGGFLISAMNKMVQDAKGDLPKIKLIKENQLIGVEWQDDIFALACSNMFIHQDGKTNIVHGDCFDPLVIDVVKEYSPNIGFLNPPYTSGDNDRLELEFVLNNLEQLAPNGTCVAIVPMSCVLTGKSKDVIMKGKILQSHTLEGVLSMPDQLFHNSKVAVVTSVLIITAHKPHPVKKKTWFGYFKNDGYKVQKHKGRVDLEGNWNNSRAQWVSAFTNREEIKGLSVIREVTAKDEWCAEAYMDTDYSQLGADSFIKELKKYAAFKILITD